MQGSSARSFLNPLKKLQRKEDLEKEFVESGEKDRVQEVVERRLHESGWAKRVESMCEEYIAKKGYERVELQAMVDELKDASRRIVPDEVKRELMQLIQEFVNSRTSTGEGMFPLCYRRAIRQTLANPQTIEASSFHFSRVLGQNLDAASKRDERGEEVPLWKDPYKHAMPEQKNTFSEFREAKVHWEYVRRLLPRRLIPEIPKNAAEGVTPSGWRAPREKAPNLPYYIRRKANHLPSIFLERRRDELNPKTMDFEYVELVILTGIDGDVFACERDLRAYCEKRLGHPIATHVDELKGKIKISGVDRTIVEQFVYDYETEFSLCGG
ncbi:hypothetical protein niasHT_022562 [Heterodera trifolii]|uniref:Transcription and mRNA export factor ENY2 n=1 Tax=Heterodera trifolii TaxID=157864 RepID=A0ABD2JRA8_9BILA